MYFDVSHTFDYLIHFLKEGSMKNWLLQRTDYRLTYLYFNKYFIEHKKSINGAYFTVIWRF